LHPCSKHVHETRKKPQNQQTSKRDNKEAKKAHKRVNKEREHTKGADKHVIKQGNKKMCSKRTNVVLDLVSLVPLYWNMGDT